MASTFTTGGAFLARGLSLDFSEYFTTDPGSTMRTNGSGVVNNFPSSGYDMDQFVTPLTHHTDAPNTTGYLRMTVDNPPAGNQGGAKCDYLTSDHLTETGNDLKKFWLRMWRRGSFTETGNTDMVGKFQYYTQQNLNCSTFNFLHTNMTGNRSGSITTADMTYSTTTGLWTGTCTTGLGTIPKGTGIIFTSGAMRATWANNDVSCIHSYNSTTGALVLYSRWGAELTEVPVNGSAFKVMPDMGDSYTFGSATGDICQPDLIENYRFGAINTVDTPVDTTSGTLVFAGGEEITSATVARQDKRSAADILSSSTAGDDIGVGEDVNGEGLDCLCWSHWTTGGYFEFQRNSGGGAFNLAANDFNFVTRDHPNEWFEIKYFVDITVTPWVVKMYVTNQDAIDVHGLADGAASNISTVTHFNNHLYLHVEVPFPVANFGMNLELGSYMGNDLDVQTGQSQDFGMVEIVDGDNGGVDPFKSGFTKGVA